MPERHAVEAQMAERPMNEGSLFERYTVPVVSVLPEGSDAATIVFDLSIAAHPGQFLMISDLETDDKPFSISGCANGTVSVTARRIGPFSDRLLRARPGDRFSVRGAYGSSFFAHSGSALLIGGGCAVPPLAYLAETLVAGSARVTFVNGARDRSTLLCRKRLANLPLRQIVALEAENGTTAVDQAVHRLQTETFERIYAAGPEAMLVALLPHCNNTPTQFLIERYMKCGMGICGSCTLDPLGLRVCVEGPVLDREVLLAAPEFGVYRRDASGARVPLENREVCTR